MTGTNIALRRKSFHRNSANSNRRAAAALIAASAGLAMFSAADSAYGTTYTFSSAGGDWQTPANWTPNGTPIAGDVAIIRTGSTADSTITDGTMSVGELIDNANGVTRILSNADLVNPSQLTLTGVSGQPLIQLNNGSGTSYTIAGFNATNSTGTLNLVLGASGQFLTAVNGTLSISANISETGGSQGFTKTGFGSLSLSGSNSFTGATDVHRGNLLLDFTNNTGAKLSSFGSLIFEGASLFMQGNASQAVTQSVADIYLNAAQNTISVTSNGQNTILNAGLIHRAVGAYANINYGVNGGAPAVEVADLNNAYGILGGWLTFGNNDWAAESGGVVVPLTSAGGYSTTDNVSNWIPDTNVTNDTSPYTGTLANDSSIASIRFNDNSAASTVTMASGKTLTIDTGGVLIAGSNAATDTITGGNLTSGVDEIIATTGSNKTLKINSVIADRTGSSTGLSITKSGSGTIQLLGANTNTGNIYINTGTLVANTIAATGSPSSLGASGTIYLGSTDTVSTPARLIYSGASTSTDRPWVIGEGGGAFNISANNATLTLSGPISGTGSITVNNTIMTPGIASTLAIQGANTFTGMTYLTSGAIAVDTLAPIGQNSSIGTGLSGGTVVLGDGAAGTLTYTGSSDATTNRLLQLGSANAGGSINLVSTNPNVTLTWTGLMQFASGTPTLINGSSVAFATTTANNPRPFQLGAAGTIIFAGNIGNGTLSYGQLQKTGAGTVILTGSNSYQIGTTVNSGTLITATNFSNGTITNVGTTSVIGLNVLGGYAQVEAKPLPDQPSGFTVIPSINIGASSQLDLTNNGLDIYNATSSASQIRGYLQAGYNGGAWNGAGGIISSTAAAASTTSTQTALGYATGSELPSTTFDGHTIAPTDTIVAYVLQGDANMDGTVNALDFNALATNYGSTTGDWAQGDFDYSSTINSSDFSLLAANYGKSLPTSAALPDAALQLGAVVPEPTTIALLSAMGGLLTMRRRSSKM